MCCEKDIPDINCHVLQKRYTWHIRPCVAKKIHLAITTGCCKKDTHRVKKIPDTVKGGENCSGQTSV